MPKADFSLGFRFAGAAHLAGPEGSPIWPPEPCRVVAAMLATAFHHRLDSRCLETLETLPPDVHYCEDALPSPSYELSVPANHDGKHHSAMRQRPYVCLPRTDIHAAYTWRIPHDQVRPLMDIGIRISHLGAGASLVTAGALTIPPVPTLVPDREGHRSLRCAPAGYVQALIGAFENGNPAPYLGKDIRYRWADQHPQECGGPWSPTSGALRLSQPVDAADGVHFASAIRSAVMSTLGDIPPEVHGHDSASSVHVAWVPIPHRDVLLGIGCWIPKSMAPAHALRVTTAFARLRELRFRGRRLPLDIGGQGLLQDRVWAGYSNTWESATPIALLRHPRRQLSADDVIAEGLIRDGYPEPERIQITQWGVPARTRRCRTPRVHAVITWPHPLRGPVLAGAERHYGLGLCRPVNTVR